MSVTQVGTAERTTAGETAADVLGSAPDPARAAPAAAGATINLIMSGGGARLAAYVGAITAFREMGLQFGAIASSSAGSIVGAFVAAGWSPERMHAKLLETDFTRFKDRRLKGLIFEGGLYAGNVFERWMEKELQGARFCDLPGDLMVVAVDLIGQAPFVFSRQTTPEVPVSKAVRCSMAIPWVWRPQRLGGKLLADGQLMPWISTGIEMMQATPAGARAMRTVILRLLSDPRQARPAKRRLWPWDFARILLDTMLIALDNQRVPGALWPDTILIRVGPIRPLQLRLTREMRDYLYRCGYEQAFRYFDKGSTEAHAVAPT
jgi:NTE family protein